MKGDGLDRWLEDNRIKGRPLTLPRQLAVKACKDCGRYVQHATWCKIDPGKIVKPPVDSLKAPEGGSTSKGVAS